MTSPHRRASTKLGDLVRASWRIRILVATFALAHASMIVLTVASAVGTDSGLLREIGLLCRIG